MKLNLVFLIMFGLAAGMGFAISSTDYSGFILRDVTPSGNPIPVWNCDPANSGPFNMHMRAYLDNPFEQITDAAVYIYNPNTAQWFFLQNCTNIDASGEECKFNFPLYWGMGRNGTSSIDLVRIDMVRGGDNYSKKFNFNIQHLETNFEATAWQKMAYLDGLIAELDSSKYCTSDGTACCPTKGKVDALRTVDAQTLALGHECKVDEARQYVMQKINEGEAVKQEAANCSAAIAVADYAHSLAAGCNAPELAQAVGAMDSRIGSGDYSVASTEVDSIYNAKCKGIGGAIAGAVGNGTTSGTPGTGTGTSAGTGAGTPGTGTSGNAAGTGTTSGGSGCPVGFVLLLALLCALFTREE